MAIVDFIVLRSQTIHLPSTAALLFGVVSQLKSLFVWIYWVFYFIFQISNAKQDLENQKAESDKKIKQHASDSKVNKMARDGADQLRIDVVKDRRALQKAVDSAKVDLEEKAKELTKYQTLVGCTSTQAWS